jgi:hypothetical protein
MDGIAATWSTPRELVRVVLAPQHLKRTMKRVSIVVILMLVLAACGLPDADSSYADGPSGDGPSGDGYYYTVSGQIVGRDTGAPYPKAYVKFAWLVNSYWEKESHIVTDDSGSYAIQLPAGQYQVTANDPCDLNAAFAIAGRDPYDIMITVPGTSEVNFVEYESVPGSEHWGC